MTTQRHSTVVGVFEDRRQADKAVEELRRAGFRNEQIGVAFRDTEGMAAAKTSSMTDTEDSHAGTGALAGALAGIGLGTLAGIGVLAGAIPIVGPAIAGGTLGIILSNAALGAGVAGLVGALIGAGIPEEEAHYYQGEFEAGRTIVTVHADDRADDAAAILRKYGAYDRTSRDSATASASRAAATGTASSSTVTTGGACATGTGTAHHATAARAAEEAERIQVKEERLTAEKHPVEAGEVRVRKEVHTETKTLEVPVQREEVVIERHPVQGRVEAGEISDTGMRAGEEIRIPIREEQVDVSKQAVVTEEVEVGKRVVQDTKQVTGQVRKEEVHVEHKGDVNVCRDEPDKPTK